MSVNLTEILGRLKADPLHEVLPPQGLPKLREGHVLPSEVRAFYERCGGLKLNRYKEVYYSWRLVSPDEFRPATEIVIGKELNGMAQFWENHWASGLYVFGETDDPREKILVSCSDRDPFAFLDGHPETYATDDMKGPRKFFSVKGYDR